MMDVEKKIREILERNLGLDVSMEQVGLNYDLSNLGINSLNLIKILVDIETEYDFEFEDEVLNYDYFRNLKSLIDYVKAQV